MPARTPFKRKLCCKHWFTSKSAYYKHLKLHGPVESSQPDLEVQMNDEQDSFENDVANQSDHCKNFPDDKTADPFRKILDLSELLNGDILTFVTDLHYEKSISQSDILVIMEFLKKFTQDILSCLCSQRLVQQLLHSIFYKCST